MYLSLFHSLIVKPVAFTILVFLLMLLAERASAQITPTYLDQLADPTLQNSVLRWGEHHWYVPPGADNHALGIYERPLTQSFKQFGATFATDDGNYWESLDIKSGSYGFDEQFLYFRIGMVGPYRRESDGGRDYEGLMYEYNVRLDTSPSGAYGYLFVAEEPTKFGTSFTTEKNFAYRDGNGDANRRGNGYEGDLVADGKSKHTGARVFYSRIDPTDHSAVEFAIQYQLLGINPVTISRVTFEATKGLKGPSNYPWNRKYNGPEAGSPNPGPGGKSEFGTSGLGNIYELDTLSSIPDFKPRVKEVKPPTGSLSIPRTVYRRGTSIQLDFKFEYPGPE